MRLDEQINRIKEIMGVLNESSQHIENLYKSWAIKKSKNPEMAMKIMNDVLNNQKKLTKKDFSKYSSYDELVSDLMKVKDSSKSKDITVFYKGDMSKGDDLLVISPNTWESSCEYGSSSKWCTTSRDTDTYWEKHNRNGTEFFWIFRSKPNDDPNHKFSFHIQNDGKTDWCNAINRCERELPEKSYPLEHPMYDEIVSKLRDYHNQRGNNGVYSKYHPIIFKWIEDNFEKIFTILDIENRYYDQFKGTIDSLGEDEIEEIIYQDNDELELNDDLYNYIFDSLTDFNPPFNIRDYINETMINSISRLVITVPDCLDQFINKTITPESFVNTLKSELYDIIDDELYIIINDLIHEELLYLTVNY